MRITPLLPLLLVLTGILPLRSEEAAAEKAPDALKEQLPDYIRFASDEASDRLEVAVKRFRAKDNVQVDLIGVVHIADADYYAELNRRFEDYDAVLFELVGDPKAVTQERVKEQDMKREKSVLSTIQGSAGRFLKLKFQLTEIDYTKPNMVHADTSMEEFQAMQKERGETMIKLFIRALRAQLNGELDAEAEALQELDTFGLLRVLMSKDSAREFKTLLAKMFDQAESMTAKIEGKEGSAILSGRNEVVAKKLDEVLADGKKRKVAIFYGAAHMPGLERLIMKSQEAKAVEEEWLSAWTMPKPAKEEKPQEKPTKTRTL